ncbi:MAG: 2-phospho-L-lactate guanylyltransferase [Terriglobia bacterium]
MKALLIPVKNWRQAKQRLAPVLCPADRMALAAAMFEDVCAAAMTAQGVDQVFVISSYEPAMDRARALGWEVIGEERQLSESASVDFASRLCAERGVGSLLRLPADVPLIRPEDINLLFRRVSAGPSVVISPSRSGTGTNALLRTPPTVFGSHFGPNSFAKHLREVEKSGARCAVVRNVRLAMDIDDAEDLQAVLPLLSSATATGRWLAGAGFTVGRISQPAPGP